MNESRWINQLAATISHIVVLSLALACVPGTCAVEVWLTAGDKTDLLTHKSPVSFSPGTGAGGFSIDVSASQTFQTMAGFGAALTDSSAWLIDTKLNASQRTAVLDALFSTTAGAGMNYLRLPMGASDFTAAGFYTYNDLAGGQSDGTQSQFSVEHDATYIIPLLQQIRAVNPELQLMGTPWTAPAWMKTNDSLFGGALDSQWYGSYAIYLKKFVDAYEAAGLPIAALTLQNEPLFTPGNYPSMGMSAAAQADIIKNHVGPVFAAAGIDTDLILYDHNWDNTDFADQVLDDPLARQYVAGSAFHGYAGNVSAQSILHEAHPDKDIYFTEISGGEFAPNFADNLVWGIKNIIIGSARNWGRTSLYWNLALDENNGPHLNGCSDCRGVVTIDSSTGEIEYNEEFYTIAHASKFVRPGAVRIDSRTIDDVVETVAFENLDGSKVLLVLNPTNSTHAFRIVENNQFFAYSLDGKSVATFVWDANPVDFNRDGSVDGADVDQLVAEIVAGTDASLFDLNADGLVNVGDLDDWLLEAGQQNLGAGYLVGDSNLDGTVDGGDFLVWNLHKFAATAAWTLGDFSADGFTDGGDFLLWNANKFLSSDEVMIVPEPSLGWLIVLVGVARHHRRRH